MRIVMKFGGVSVKDGENILHSANLVKKFANGNEIVVVVSAMAGVTDSLLSAAKKCSSESSAGFVKLFVADMMKKHYEAVEKAVTSEEIK
ncbi:MAG: aspartate kinase, partial [Archaeoglobaceae archaeon]